MAQIISVKLSRFDSQPWGFRLQGGKDFGTPLVIQKVNVGSLAEKAGLQAGDAVIRVNDSDIYDLRHKESQDVIVRAGNSFEITVQRGGSTWKPAVAPVGHVPPAGSGYVQPVTKTSLAATKKDGPLIGSGHNVSARPFSTSNVQVNGEPTVKSIVNKQYNSPVGIYSEESIAETLSAQAEVLAGGVLGVNFKKNEQKYNAANSEVFKMVQEIDSEPREPEPVKSAGASFFATASHAVGGGAVSPRPLTPLARQLITPSMSPSFAPSGAESSETPKCSECESFISGVFVRIKEKNLHVECFKCATCGTSLKNVGYYRINDKLYCDVHAKLVARQNPPGPNLEPITIPPGGRGPAGTISAAVAPTMNASIPPSVPGNLSPQPGTLGPLPFHAPSSNLSGPKPFGSSPASTLTRPTSAAPLIPNSGPKLGGSAPGGGSQKGATYAGSSAPRRGKGVLNPSVAAGARVPLCAHCNGQIRGPFVTALGKIWCPEHFVCVKSHCRRPLADIGFVEEQGDLYCEYCFEQFIAPTCNKCGKKVKGDCLNAIGKHFHPECFACSYCGKLFGNNPFFLEEGEPYCAADWNELFTTKCFACGFPIEAGDRWVEALNNNYHSQCFNCTNCKKNLEGQSFYAKGGRPFCKAHAR